MAHAYPLPPQNILSRLRQGQVIPAHPLALTAEHKLDERHQRALTRYYLACGAGGLAVAVHTTQFAIHDPWVGLLEPVLQLARDTVQSPETILIAGICGATNQAVHEARLARDRGYHIGLLSFGALKTESEDRLIDHARAVAEVIPIMGFYLQPAVGGRLLSEPFWRRLAAIPNLVAIKIAAFNRYQTLDVLRAAAQSGRAGEIALYTGNDDNIVIDLLTEYRIALDPHPVIGVSIVGGLLGHWAFWTKRAVELRDRIQTMRPRADVPADLLTLAAQVTESNQAVFDPEHYFAGCVPGILYVLQRVGLVAGVHTLDPQERLSPGQTDRIEAVIRRYPHLTDDAFVREHLDQWLKP